MLDPTQILKLIPPHVIRACESYETDEDGDAVASVEFRMDVRVILHIRTDGSHWERSMELGEFLVDIGGAWADGLRWLGV